MTGRPARAPKKFDRSIVEGPLPRAVWRLAWPTMLQNMVGGLQGIVDHAMVGHYVGHTGNAAIGVSMQLFILVIVFVVSVFTGMGVLVARFAGAGDTDKVNRAVYQAFLTAVFMAVAVMAPIGYLLAPWFLTLVNAAPEVQVEALPYIRIMFVFSIGMLIYFMMSGALRAAGDAQTPLRLGILMTALNVVLNVVFIGGLGPIPAMGTTGAAIGTAIAGILTAVVFMWLLLTHRLVIRFPESMSWRPDWHIIRELFRFGLPTGVQGVVMNLAGVLLFRFIGSLEHSAEAQAAYAVGYTELFSLVTWTSVGLMGATAAVAGQNLGAGHPDRSAQAAFVAARVGLGLAAVIGVLFLVAPRLLLGFFALDEGVGYELGRQLLAYLAVSGLFVTVALTYTGGLQGTGDTRSPLYISIVSQVVVPIGLCTYFSMTRGLQPADIWLAIVLGHATRALLSVLRFRQGKWRDIAVDIRPARA
ncbi:MAG TPA: MATE family efflux transporter [Vicinamibacterales bacterium]|nr:MATE family efflux transporter [Vicinamibacterales bacterium]